MRIIIVLIVAIALISCKDETVVSEISGTIYSDCNLQANSYSEVALKVNPGNSFSEPIIIGGDEADGNGYFKFNYELNENEEGTADLILVGPSGYINLATNLKLQSDYSLYLFAKNEATVVVNLLGNRVFSNSDTLFLSLSSNLVKSQVIAPQNGFIDTLTSLSLNPIETSTSTVLLYGIGSSDYQRSLDSLNSGKFYNHINLELSGCIQNDLVDLTID